MMYVLCPDPAREADSRLHLHISLTLSPNDVLYGYVVCFMVMFYA